MLSWETFVDNCARAVDAGLTEREFGRSLVAEQIQWTGTVRAIRLQKGGFVPGLSVDMPPREVPLKRRGWAFVASDLFLKLGSEPSKALGRRKNVGEKISFTARFRDQEVFANVRFTVDDEQRKVFLSLGLQEGELNG